MKSTCSRSSNAFQSFFEKKHAFSRNAFYRFHVYYSRKFEHLAVANAALFREVSLKVLHASTRAHSRDNKRRGMLAVPLKRAEQVPLADPLKKFFKKHFKASQISSHLFVSALFVCFCCSCVVRLRLWIASLCLLC